MDVQGELLCELEKLNENMGFLEFVGRVRWSINKFTYLKIEKECEDERILIQIAALCTQLLSNATRKLEEWGEEIIAQATDVEDLPNFWVFSGLIETLFCDLLTCYSIHEDVDFNSLVKIGAICIARIKQNQSNLETQEDEGDVSSKQDAR